MTNDKEETTEFIHVSVLSQELIEGVTVSPGGYYLDATVGGGGHSKLILSAFANVRVMAIDRDKIALVAAQERLAEFGERVRFWQGNFADFDPGIVRFDGIIADLGVSSPQLDVPERGFSFQQTGGLDMRMDLSQSLTAAEVVNTWDEKELADIFYEYGEERLSRRIARRIVEKRPFTTTTDLADAIAFSVPPKYRHGRIHPATRVFQALRIVVNAELQSLETLLEKAPHWLKEGGKIGIISFHSLEDRIVKHQLRESPVLKVLTKKPITASPEEEAKNRRSRSAKLRLAQKITQESE